MNAVAGRRPSKRLAMSARWSLALAALTGRTRREFQGILPDGVIPPRGSARRGAAIVNDATALRHSAVWAALRIRADLISTFPIDVFRKGSGDLKGIDVEVPTPPILVEPGGSEWDYPTWCWASQHQYDGSGNTVGLITEWDGMDMPARIDLVPIASVTVMRKKGERLPTYKIDGVEYKGGAWTKRGDPGKVWHERQYPVPGLPVGMSPLAYAAWSVGEFLSIQDFALDWFGGGAVPKARMKNTKQKLLAGDITAAKQWYRDVIDNGDLLVTGNDWEYDMIQAQNAGMEWLNARNGTMADVARFLGVPADLIDAAMSGQSITYANMTQRNLQFLIMNLGPAVIRRETSLSKLTSKPRYVKMNTAGLLRMDPETAEKIIDMRIKNKTLVNHEARALNNLAPLTQADEDEAARLYPVKVSAPATAPGEDPNTVGPSPAMLAAWAVDQSAPRSPIAIGDHQPW